MPRTTGGLSHAERQELDLVRRELRHELAHQGGVLLVPAPVENDRIDVEADGRAPALYHPGGLEPAMQRCGAVLLVANQGVGVEPPGDDDVGRDLVTQEVVDLVGSCLELELHVRIAAGESEQGVQKTITVSPHQ